jgi:hypothetical protein
MLRGAEALGVRASLLFLGGGDTRPVRMVRGAPHKFGLELFGGPPDEVRSSLSRELFLPLLVEALDRSGGSPGWSSSRATNGRTKTTAGR